VSLFRINVTDEIHLDAFSTGIGNTNLPPSRRDGLEIETNWIPTHSLTFSGAYTYLRPKFLEGVFPGSVFTAVNVDVAGKTVPLVPEHKLNLSASWSVCDRTVLGATFNYVGKQFMDNDEANDLGTMIPAYGLLDVKLIHRIGPWSMRTSINNLFDRKYYNYAIRSQLVADRYSSYPLPERSASVALEYTFK
jgi:iron complex outermembrane receptor protein